MRNWLRSSLVALSLLLVGAIAYDRTVCVHWVGSTQLTVELQVVDAETLQPINDAEILIFTESNRGLAPEEQPIRMRTNRDGTARHECPSATTAGQQSGLGFTDTWSVAPQDWLLTVRAEGYVGTDDFTLTGPHRGTAMRNGTGQARLVVLIPVRKAQP